MRQAVERAAHWLVPEEQALGPRRAEAGARALSALSLSALSALSLGRVGGRGQLSHAIDTFEQIWEGVAEQARRKQLM